MNRLCTMEGCGRLSFHRSPYCERHYRRNLKHGSPLGGRKTFTGEGQQWLKDHVGWEGDACLIWPFATSEARGYGFTKFERKDMHAHRAMCILAHGEPESQALFALHSCGKGHEGCVNPKHLRWGTPLENTHDRVDHGTMLEGETHPQAVLTVAEVLTIRSLRGVMTQSKLGEMFGVSQTAIYRIQTGRTWKSVPNDPSAAT